MEGHTQCSLLIRRGGWRGIESAHGYLGGVNGGAFTVLTVSWKG